MLDPFHCVVQSSNSPVDSGDTDFITVVVKRSRLYSVCYFRALIILKMSDLIHEKAKNTSIIMIIIIIILYSIFILKYYYIRIINIFEMKGISKSKKHRNKIGMVNTKKLHLRVFIRKWCYNNKNYNAY